MPSTPILPFETEQTIIDLLAEDDENHSALKTCSLVCKAFLHMCRKHIFASIILDNPNAVHPSPTTHALAVLLSERPEIADYVLKLEFNFRVGDLISPSIQESLKRISRLAFLTVRHHNTFYRPKFDWSDNPIRSTLLHLLHLPTLTHFRLFGVKNFVVSDLIHCLNLKYLNIGLWTTGATETTFPAALPDHPIQPNEIVAGTGAAPTIMKLCTTRRPDGQSLIDFRSLSKITMVLDESNDGQASQELFRRCNALTDVHISRE
jgi:hypothetical protein